MKMTYMPLITAATTVFVLASAASFAIDPTAPRRSGLENTVAMEDLCAADSCSVVYKTEAGGRPSHVVTVR